MPEFDALSLPAAPPQITEFVTPAGPFGLSCFLIGFAVFLLILILVIEQCGGFEE